MAINKDKTRAAAQKYLQKGQLDKAIIELQRLVEDDPKDVRTLLKIGDLETRIGKHAEATVTYGRVAQFYSEQGFFLKAVAVYKQILKIDPDVIEINQKLADLYHQLGLVSDAINQYRQLSAIYEKQGKGDESIDLLKKMVEIDPENVASRIKLAEIYAKSNMTEEARAEFKAAATQLKGQHRIDDYAKVAERIVFFDPGDLATTRELANIYVQKGDARRALAKLQVCFKADPKDPETLLLLANAFKDLDQVPKTISVYRELAAVHKEAGNHDAYVGVMRKILDLAPDDSEAQAVMDEQRDVKPVSRVTPSQRPITPPAAVHEVDRRHKEDEEIHLDVDLDLEVDAPPVRAAPKRSAGKDDDVVGRVLTEVDVYIKYGLKPKALEHIQKVFEVDPKHREAHLRHRQLLLELQGPAAAADELFVMASQAHEAGNDDLARNDLEELLGIQPAHPNARALLTRIAPSAKQPPPDELDGLAAGATEAVPAADEDEVVLQVGVDEVLGSEAPDLSYEPSPAAAAIDLDEGLDDEAPSKSAKVVSGKGALPVTRERPSERMGARAAPIAKATTHSQSGTSTLGATPDKKAAKPALDDELEALLKSAVPNKRGAAPAKSRADTELDALLAGTPAARTRPRTETEARPEPRPESRPEVKAKPAEPVQAKAPAEAPAAVVTPAAAVEPASPAQTLAEEIEEVEFYSQQGLANEAHDALANLLAKHPDDAGVLALKVKMEGATPPATPEQAAAPDAPAEPLAAAQAPSQAAASDDEPEPQFETLNIAEEIEREVKQVPDDEQVPFQDVFEEFKRGVAKQVDESDFETHYNLGIAYKEMGLLDDAVREFMLSQKSSTRSIGSLTMIGLCQLELGNTAEALDHFLKGLNAKDVTAQEAMALRYEIGQAYESMSRFREAAKFYEKVGAVDSTFRDVGTRLAEVKRRSGEQKGEAGSELDALLTDGPTEGSAPVEKARKISYV